MAVAPTDRLKRVRRQLLQGMVDENLDTIAGRPVGWMRRLRQQRAARLRRLITIAVPVLVAGLAVAAGLWSRDVAGGSARDVGADRDHSASRITIPLPQPRVDTLLERLAMSTSDPLVPDVIPVEVARIALDPGHGGVDGGTSMGYGLLEKDLTKDIANRLEVLLEAASWEVVMTRTGDETVSLKERAAIANASGADLMLSIHINWLPNRTARGFETYYLGPTEDPFLRRLAAAENRDSGYALADYRRLLEGVFADVRHTQSRDLARSIQEELFATLRRSNPDIVSRGVMTAPFAVLVSTEMPAALVEVACLSNDREARLLAMPSYRQRIAEALFAGVTAFARDINAPPIEPVQGS